MVEAKFFESLLLLGRGFLVPGPARLELHLAPPQELAHTVGVGILDTSLAQEPMSLPDRGYLTPYLKRPRGVKRECGLYLCTRSVLGGSRPFARHACGTKEASSGSCL